MKSSKEVQWEKGKCISRNKKGAEKKDDNAGDGW